MKQNAILLSLSFLFTSLGISGAQQFDFTTIAGAAGIQGFSNGSNTTTRFNGPYGLAVDKGGNIYVADHDNDLIRKITRIGGDWVATTVAGARGQRANKDGTNGSARFFFPDGIAVDTNGILFVADSANNTIRRIMLQGTNWVVNTLAGNPANSGYADGTNGQATFFEPTGIAVDNAGNVFVTDYSENLIRKVSPMGTNWIVNTIAGFHAPAISSDGTNNQARFAGPRGIAVDGSGNLFVSDYLSFTIREITPVGTNWVVTTIAGQAGQPGAADGTNAAARFNAPQGVALDAVGNLYVVDSNFQSTNPNDLIRKISPIGTNWVVTTLGGTPNVSGSADGIGSAALFNNPWGIAVDSAGNLYVADFNNDTIRLGQPVTVPQLSIRLQGGMPGFIQISWPATQTNFLLETGSNLQLGTWTPLTGGITLQDGTFVFTNVVESTQVFYRLHKQ